jgi:predicted dehydrogenase
MKTMKKKISRRQFLKRSALISGGAIGFPTLIRSSALGLAGTVAPSNRVVMGCIGVGGQGTGNMRAFMNQPEVQVVAVCDVDTNRRNQAQNIVREFYAAKDNANQGELCASYLDYRELLARDDIDAVSIGTPDHWHGLITVAAAQSGKDIYCEKPLVNTIEEGRAVCNAVQRYGRVLQTGSHERSRHSVRFACELVRNGRIGKLHTIQINMPNSDGHHRAIIENENIFPTMPVPDGFDYDMWLGPTPSAAYTERRCHFWWRFIFDYGGGEMTDRGAHIIDLAQLGNNTDHSGPVELVAEGEAPKTGLYDAFLKYHFECTYANGVKMIGASVDPRGLKFIGSDGWIFIHIHGGRLEAEPASFLQETLLPEEVHLGRSPGHHRNFLDAVKARTQPMASAEIGHRTATICHLLNIAMLTKSPILWDPEKEIITNNPKAQRLVSRPMRSPWYL